MNPFDFAYGTNTVAISAVSLPWWLPHVQHVSQGAALVLPVLGVIWITMQITSFILQRKKNKN